MHTFLRRFAVAAPGAGGIIAGHQYSYADTTVTTVVTTTTTTTTTKTIPDAPIDPNYPPHGLTPAIKTLPEWIQLGCGDAEYMCPEKGATFPADVCPDKMPDLSEH